MLVIAPLSTLTPVWERELFQLMLKNKCEYFIRIPRKTAETVGEAADICVINHHGLRV